MTEPASSHSRSSSSAAAAPYPMPPPSPKPSVASRASNSSLRRQAAISSGLAASISPPQQRPLSQISHPEQATEPKFTQLFTTLTSTSTSSHKSTTHYPTVHYIFADDDDPDLLTEALSRNATAQHPDRAILIDLHPSSPETTSAATGGYSVLAAASLSPDWAVTSTRVSHTDTGTIQGGSTAAGSLVLEIEGIGFETPRPQQGQTATKEQKRSAEDPPPPGGDYAALLDQFDKGMGGLRKVVEVAEGRRRVMEAGIGELGDEGVEEETQMPEEETQRPLDERDVQGSGEGDVRRLQEEGGDLKEKGKAVYAEGDEEDGGGDHTG